MTILDFTLKLTVLGSGLRRAEGARAGARPAPTESVRHKLSAPCSPLLLVFEVDKCGKSLYLCAFRENTCGECGPWSEILHAIVP
jgi:hypothetical protein